MKHGLLCTLGLIVLGMVVFGTSPAGAASAVGPYYATPSWDQKLDASTRFIVLTNWGSAAVLDRETGLVWEQSPRTAGTTWDGAEVLCNKLSTGGRLGWRLPTIQELASLVDPSVAPPGLTLPSGHPFSNVQSAFYWSATTSANITVVAWGVWFVLEPFVDFAFVESANKADTHFFWCVRGGQGVDHQ